MTKKIIRFFNVLLVALVTGTIFGIWLGYSPFELSASAYIEQQQQAIRSLNTLMPLLGLASIILTLVSAFLCKSERGSFAILIIATVFLVFSGLITKFGNQPINSVVMTWEIETPPANWMELRNQWWFYHVLRTSTSLIALALIVWTSMKKD